MRRLGTMAAALFIGATGALAADAYEVVTVTPPAGNAALGIFRVNVTTGQVVTAWGGSKTYSEIAEPAPIPAGQYHLRVRETLDQKGVWYLIRFDSQSGRFWVANGGGKTPYSWSEIIAPK